MQSATERDVSCPRCGYNLRGLTTPRCPECAFEFTFEELRGGLLRENIPTWLDRCDPWQPHQVAIRSLYELLRGALRPRRLLTKLDVNGPMAPAWLMLICGTLWLWLLTAAIVAVGIVLHTGASPAVAMKSGILVWGPRIVLPSLAFACGLTILATTPVSLGASRPTIHQRFRLGAFLWPTLTAYGCIPAAAVLSSVPELVLEVGLPQLTPIFLVALVLRLGKRRTAQAPPRSYWLALTLLILVCLLAGKALAAWLRPDSLEPPWWVYFF
ncbi:MAG: hypothetical protein ABIG44_04035 [Planctomycetota bacterium]